MKYAYTNIEVKLDDKAVLVWEACKLTDLSIGITEGTVSSLPFGIGSFPCKVIELDREWVSLLLYMKDDNGHIHTFNEEINGDSNPVVIKMANIDGEFGRLFKVEWEEEENDPIQSLIDFGNIGNA